jgi:hypothetical protein
LSVQSIDDNVFENIFCETLSLQDIKTIGIDLIDITDSNFFDVSNQNKSNTLKSGSTCSSRSSHTNDNDLDELDDINENDNNSDNNDNNSHNNDNNNEDINEIDSEEEDDEDEEEESIILTFPKFPVQVICMENCENTFDNLIINETLNEEEWFSALMQIIMILITYQKMFSFTHNDLHTNNIMYNSTNKKFIYYTYKKKTYKVPTFGKIYKLIEKSSKTQQR